MGFLDSLFGSKSESESSQTRSPWGPQIPHLTKQFGESERLYDEGGPGYFPGPTQADRSPLITGGEEQQLGYIGSPEYQALIDKGQEATSRNLSGGYFGYDDMFNDPNVGGAYKQALSGDPSPYTEAAARATREDMAEDYTGIGGIGSQIRNAGVMSGQHGGGTRQGLMERKGRDDLDENMRQMTANMYQQDYGDAQNRMMEGMRLAESGAGRRDATDLNRYSTGMGYVPQQFSTGLAAGDIQKGIGGDRQGYEQEGIQHDIARHDFEQTQPYRNLDWYRGATSGDYGGTTTGTSSTTNTPSLWDAGQKMFSAGTGLASGIGALSSGSGIASGMSSGGGFGGVPYTQGMSLMPQGRSPYSGGSYFGN